MTRKVSVAVSAILSRFRGNAFLKQRIVIAFTTGFPACASSIDPGLQSGLGGVPGRCCFCFPTSIWVNTGLRYRRQALLMANMALLSRFGAEFVHKWLFSIRPREHIKIRSRDAKSAKLGRVGWVQPADAHPSHSQASGHPPSQGHASHGPALDNESYMISSRRIQAVFDLFYRRQNILEVGCITKDHCPGAVVVANQAPDHVAHGSKGKRTR